MNGLTVVIPTYNRKDVLQLALEGYLAQTSPGGIREILVVDDGSTDGTDEMVTNMGGNSPFPIRYLFQENSGPAAARNSGIREARSNLILFTDSDIVPSKNFVAEHLRWHAANPDPALAVLGYVTWPAHPKPTPFMKWYGESGKLFAFGEFKQGQEIDGRHLYSCNVSFKTEFLKTQGIFDEDFRTAAYEDTELGYRLSRLGLKLFYNQNAIAYHHQYFRFEEACRKAIANGPATAVFLKKEAGIAYLSPRIERRKHLRFKVSSFVARAAATMLRPAEALLDGHIPLPGIVYRILFWYRGTRLIDISSD